MLPRRAPLSADLAESLGKNAQLPKLLGQPRDQRSAQASAQKRFCSPMTLAATPVSATAEEQHEDYDNQNHFHGKPPLTVMGRFSAKPLLTFFGWAGTALMAVTVVALIWSSFG
jgi:hypothetical protein